MTVSGDLIGEHNTYGYYTFCYCPGTC